MIVQYTVKRPRLCGTTIAVLSWLSSWFVPVQFVLFGRNPTGKPWNKERSRPKTPHESCRWLPDCARLFRLCQVDWQIYYHIYIIFIVIFLTFLVLYYMWASTYINMRVFLFFKKWLCLFKICFNWKDHLYFWLILYVFHEDLFKQ